MLGIIGAMEVEVEKLRAKMTETEMKTVAGMNFCKGKLEGKDVVIVRSGIGKVNAGICSQILVDLYQVDGIVNTGIAGSLRNEINIGDLVLSTVAVQHDVDAGGFGYPAGEIPQLGVKEFPADERLLALAEEACREANPDISTFKGRVASGDQFIASSEAKNRIWNLFGAYCAEMEGAAVAHVCYLNKMPYVVIRSISDKADEGADISYEEFTKIAAKNSSIILEGMLKNMQ